MGGGSWKSSTWSSYSSSSGISNARSARDIYKTTVTKNEYLPYNVTRESCDSTEHPNSTPIIIGLDVSGSMSRLLHNVAKKLGTVAGEILDRKCVPDPQIMFSAIDDYEACTNECIQVTQFESDIRIAEQLTQLKFIERGAGNGYESYTDLWYFAARHTKCDAIQKGRKGILITIGDDGVQDRISRGEIKVVFGDDISEDLNPKQLLQELTRDWEVFHISMADGGTYTDVVKKEWENILGSHAIVCSDTDKIPEIIVSILEKINGKTLQQIKQSWDGSTALVVGEALKNLEISPIDSNTDVVVF